MRLLYDNYITPVIVDATLCANVLTPFNQEFCLSQTFDIICQSTYTENKVQKLSAKKTGPELLHLVITDFQMMDKAAQLLKKNITSVYENKRKSAKYLRNKLNYNL